MYVEYQDPEREIEFYDITRDPYEQRNIADQLTPAQHAQLHRTLSTLVHCHTEATCWSAAMVE